MSRITFGRKFFAGITALILLCAMFFCCVFKHPAAINTTVVMVYGSLIVTTCFAYMGGNIWKSWIMSKHFHEELVGK